jgi:uncharacterized protein (DUF885 family)
MPGRYGWPGRTGGSSVSGSDYCGATRPPTYGEKMTTVNQLADELVELTLDYFPLMSTLIGMPGPRDAQLTDYSKAYEDGYAAKISELAQRAEAIDPATLNDVDKVTRLVVIAGVDEMVTRLRSRLVEFTIVDNFSAPAVENLIMMSMINLANDEQAEAYLTRLQEIPRVLEQLADRHRAAVASGLVPVRHLVDETAEYVERYLDNDADPLQKPGLDGNEDFAARRDALIRDVVRPAYAKYRDMLLAEIAAHGRDAEHPGLSWLPGGDQVYADLIKLHTTTDRTADELHQTGLDIIAKLAEEYREIGGRVFGVTTEQEVFEHLRNDHSLRWTSSDELIDAAKAAIARAQAEAPKWFGRLPSQDCEVRPVPADEAPGAAGAYYVPPALDGSRPGVYYANTYNVTERDRHVCEATAYHEAVPGHHFQLTIQQELEELPLLRRLQTPTAYAEGWGLYTERLAREMGLYSDDIALLGMLSLDSMRAARLVVDTGLHAKGWSKQQAVQYMLDYTPMVPVEIESEVDRYIADPGQALAYMVGRLEILRIRAEAEAALGDRFDIRAFHDTVLGSGGLPLGVLDDVVRAWVQQELAA